MRAKILADPVVATRPVIDTAQTDYLALLNANSYDKGAWVLYMLHREIGRQRVLPRTAGRTTRSTVTRTALSDDLRHELEQSSGRSLAQFFDQWLRRPGVAEPAIGWAFDPSTGSVSVFVQQDERSRPVRAFPSPSSSPTPRMWTHRLVVDVPADARATVPLAGHFDRKPKSVTFDPDSVLLARITRL